MSDIVGRLRDKHCCDNGCHCDEAADTIATLRAEVLEEAARVVTEHYQELCTEHRLLLVNRAAAIRALKEKE